MKKNYTHKGWFYFVPVYLRNIEPHQQLEVCARYGLGFLFPIADWLHYFISWLHNDGFDFPFRITGEI